MSTPFHPRLRGLVGGRNFAPRAGLRQVGREVLASHLSATFMGCRTPVRAGGGVTGCESVGRASGNPQGRKPRVMLRSLVAAKCYGGLSGSSAAGGVEGEEGLIGGCVCGGFAGSWKSPFGTPILIADAVSMDRGKAPPGRRWRRDLRAMFDGDHGTANGIGGARIWCGGGSVSMTSIGAPQCRHTKTDGAERVRALFDSAGWGAGCCSSSRARARLCWRPALASSP